MPVFDAFDRELGIKKNAVAEFGDGFIARSSNQFGDPVEIDVSGLVQGDGEGVGRAFDNGRYGGMQDAFGKDGTLFGFSGFEIVVLDGRDKPNVGII